MIDWKNFRRELKNLINSHGIDHKLNITDDLLAEFMTYSVQSLIPLLHYKHTEERIELTTKDTEE